MTISLRARGREAGNGAVWSFGVSPSSPAALDDGDVVAILRMI